MPLHPSHTPSSRRTLRTPLSVNDFRVAAVRALVQSRRRPGLSQSTRRPNSGQGNSSMDIDNGADDVPGSTNSDSIPLQNGASLSINGASDDLTNGQTSQGERAQWMPYRFPWFVTIWVVVRSQLGTGTISAADTAHFDQVHLGGTNAIIRCAEKLDIKSTDRVLDIGSAYGSIGRQLCLLRICEVTGVEERSTIHDKACEITRRNMAPINELVHSVNSNPLDYTPPHPEYFDHAVSFMYVCRTPRSVRGRLFSKIAECLKPMGKLYIEDLYNRTNNPRICEDERRPLREICQVPSLPTLSIYICELQKAEFEVLEFVELTRPYAGWAEALSASYRNAQDADPELQTYFDCLAERLDEGVVGGLRIIAEKK